MVLEPLPIHTYTYMNIHIATHCMDQFNLNSKQTYSESVVYIYTCIHIYIYTYIHIHIYSIYIYTCIHIHICGLGYIYVYMHKNSTHMYVCVYMYTCMHVCMYACMHVYMLGGKELNRKVTRLFGPSKITCPGNLDSDQEAFLAPRSNLSAQQSLCKAAETNQPRMDFHGKFALMQASQHPTIRVSSDYDCFYYF